MHEKNPWKLLKDTEVYDNNWITVNHHDVINPAGNKGIYGKVHFKNYAIGIIPLDTDMNTWIVGQYRYALDVYSWEIPMGGGPLDVPVIDSAKRELKEETGIKANKWSEIMLVHPSNCVSDEIGYVFTAEDLSFGNTEFDETEEIEVRKIPFTNCVEMVMNGVITDAISVAGILKVAAMREIYKKE